MTNRELTKKYVNVFQGTGRSVKVEGGMFSRWNMFKGKAGNTSPSACLPFGCVACSPYSGGYSSGYGSFKINSGEYVQSFFEGDKLIGFSHLTHSGGGAFGFYYNYLVTVPFRGELSDAFMLKDFDKEMATPGYYTCRLLKDGINAEVTVADKVALHKYTSADGLPFKIAVDISNDGLMQPWDKRVFAYAAESEMRIEGKRVVGYAVMQGVKLYYAIACNGKPSLWIDNAPVSENQVHLEKTEKNFGALFEIEGATAETKVAFSLVSVEKALETLDTAPDFETARENASREWEKRLSNIELYGVSDEDREIFYSNYYHSLIKPCGWNNESFLWDESETFYLDFATLWDVYKTQTPLLFALHGDVGRGIAKTLMRFGRERGKLFNALLLSSNMNIEATQACCLGCYVLYDAYVYGLIDEKDVDGMFLAVRNEVGQYESGIKDGSFEKTTKLLDCTLISAAFAELAKELERADDYEYFSDVAKYWTDAFSEDGLLKENYPYYEGNRWNYSFRFVRDIQKRIAVGGGMGKLLSQLDAFFAFNDDNEMIDRFEGFNNETDMETPYFYHYVGRYDRLTALLKECTDTCFKTGRDGLPGNNDSGGLSACYIWNFLGLFPISGQDVLYVGYPKAERSVLHLYNGKTLTVVSKISDGQVRKITFNGKPVEGFEIKVSDILCGGEIIFS